VEEGGSQQPPRKGGKNCEKESGWNPAEPPQKKGKARPYEKRGGTGVMATLYPAKVRGGEAAAKSRGTQNEGEVKGVRRKFKNPARGKRP